MPFRPCWQNCFGPDDPRANQDPEISAINAMEDALAPLDEVAVQLRRLITRFEVCYHQADKEEKRQKKPDLCVNGSLLFLANHSPASFLTMHPPVFL